MTTFELNPAVETLGPVEPPGSYGLQRTILVDNTRWFIRLRWVVILILAATEVVGRLFGDAVLRQGVQPPVGWPLVTAAILAVANMGFSLLTQRLGYNSPARIVEVNLWLQIVVDLVILTTLVHIVGSTETFAPFTYLFHIVLACIFLRRPQSIAVAGLAAVLYGGCVMLEVAGFLPRSCIFIERARLGQDTFLAFASAGSALCIGLVVWHLVSSLSVAVQKRDHQLFLANEELMKADEAKNQQMLRTAHDLKAPFSGMESNIQVLRAQHWHEIPESVREIIERIEVRAMTLSERIKDILILGDLRSRATQRVPSVAVELEAVLREVIEELSEKAKERQIALHVNLPALTVMGDARQLAVLCSNLIANAILYSRVGGVVEISCATREAEATVRVADQGIGISDAALPHIFDEYYRTKEAARFNKLSTGLGLAIVRQVANNLGYRIRVSSEIEKGSTFEVSIPLSKVREGH